MKKPNNTQSEWISRHVCDEHEWPYGHDIDGDCRPMCVWCEAIRADAMERTVVELNNAINFSRKELMATCKFLAVISNSPNGARMWSSQEREMYELAIKSLSYTFMVLDGYTPVNFHNNVG